MSAHLVLLFEPDRPSTEIEPSIASELEKAGYEVIEAHNLNTAAALVFIDRRVEAVVVDAASNQIFPDLADSLSAIRPGISLLRATNREMQAPADGQAGHDWAVVISALDELVGQRAA